MADWVVTCSCGWTRECSSRWAAESVTKLHPKLSAPGVTRLQVAAGCGEWPLYSFRHHWASQMSASGESLAYVSKQLGHSKQSMTLDHYSRFIPDTKRQRGADRLAAELLAPQVAPVREVA